MVGVGFYAAAILLAVLSALCMSVIYGLEQRLPLRRGVAIAVRFEKDYFVVESDQEQVMRLAQHLEQQLRAVARA